MVSECEVYQTFSAASDKGLKGDDLPSLPDSCNPSKFKLLIGFIVHPPIFVFLIISSKLHLYRLQSMLAHIRLSSDKYSFFPRGGGYHESYTYLGIAHIKRGNIEEAIKCLDESWRIHPCPRSMSSGLWQTLRNALSDYPTAEKIIEQFDKISKEFGLGDIRRKLAVG